MKGHLIILLITMLIIGCKTDADIDDSIEPLNLISDHDLNIIDPSGLTLDIPGNFLWAVSDQSGGLVYQITFEGDSIGSLKYAGNDMEGITMNPNDETLWVVEERLRQIVQLDSQGNVLQSVEVPVEIVTENNGLEGVAIDPITEHFYIVNEKIPTEFIELNNQFEVVRRVPIQFSSPFRLEDLSGIFFVSENREFWIVSDESRKIVVTDFELNPLRSYELGKGKFDGIAVDSQIGRVYLANDDENKLYVYTYQ